MAGGASRFGFDLDFTGMGPGDPVIDEVPVHYDAEDLDRARREGHQQGLALAREENGRLLAEALGSAGAELARLRDEMAVREKKACGMAALVAVATGRQLAGEAIRRFPLDGMDALMADILGRLHGEPRLVVRVAPDLAPLLDGQLGKLRERTHHEGLLLVRGDAGLPRGDIRIDWDAGGVEISQARIRAAVDERLAGWLAACGLPEELAADPAAAPPDGQHDADGGRHSPAAGGDDGGHGNG